MTAAGSLFGTPHVERQPAKSPVVFSISKETGKEQAGLVNTKSFGCTQEVYFKI